MPNMPDLVALFDSLRMPDNTVGQGTRFSAHPIPSYEPHRLGKDELGAPSLLISVAERASQSQPAPIVLQHLTVQHDVDCRISRRDGSAEEDRFTVICCTNGDYVLNSYFLRVASAVVTALGVTPTQHDVARVIGKLVELFRVMTEPPRKSVQGLWAELFLIARTRAPAVLVSAWHQTPEDRYDFSAGSQRVEVKSTTGRVRQHHFALEQLHPPLDTNLLIVSMFVERAGAGVSVADLADQVRSHIGDKPDLLLLVDRVIGLTLGENWRRALQERFDQELAEESLAFYEPTAIPSVCVELPSGVSEVHFKSDLTASPTADLTRYRAMGGLFQVALRR